MIKFPSLLRITCLLSVVLGPSCRPAPADDTATTDRLPATSPLTLVEPLDEAMVAAIDRFAMRELAESRRRRAARWHPDFSGEAAYLKSIADNRERFRTIIGAVDPRVEEPMFEVLEILGRPRITPPHAQPPQVCAHSTGPDDGVTLRYVRWPVLKGVTAEGILLTPVGAPKALVVVLPDPSWTPEEFVGLTLGNTAKPGRPGEAKRLPLQLAAQGCLVVIPVLINREATWSGHPDVFYTNIPHREWIYRMAFEMGRHVIGYEVQKVMAAVDAFEFLDGRLDNGSPKAAARLPVGIAGVGEGGLLAFHAAALDPRIDAAMVCGYFDQREKVWEEPIYRNIFGQLTEFGDAEIAGLIAPRRLVIEVSAAPEIAGPPEAEEGRRANAAPGRIKTPEVESVRVEFNRAKSIFEKLGVAENISWAVGEDGMGAAGSDSALYRFLGGLGLHPTRLSDSATLAVEARLLDGPLFDPQARQHRQFDELTAFTQSILEMSARKRERLWSNADRHSVESWKKTSSWYRDFVHEELIGRLADPMLPPNPRSRKVIETDAFVGYEVTVDVYPDVFAGGTLLLPKGLKPGEIRPVVVCQHGLEGTPADTITTDEASHAFRAYKGFSTQLVRRGFIVYAPQNPYRGADRFRVLQRKSNPLKRSLFSYIVPQHRQTLRWLASLPFVDADRIAFYGLSYGGKTAMRVPPLLPPREDEPGYCLAICSADFNEWIRKNVSNQSRYSYLFTGEYEIFEWNMGHIANYAELASLMTPRPFMVERGHDDGVAPDEWVAWEYAKVRRHYDRLGIGGQTRIEFFDGPHTINGQGTFEFLHQHLAWPEP